MLMKEIEHKRETEKQYKHALKADPNDVATRLDYGNLLSEMGRLKEAEKQYKLILQNDPNNLLDTLITVFSFIEAVV
jgi:tetratricopeptide (TPR) repeat protein